MLDREQSEKLVIRLKTAIGCTFNYLADDKKGDIIGLAWLNVMDYSVANTIEYYKSRLKKEQAELLTASIAHQKELLTSIARSERTIVNPDPVPCTEYLKTIIRGILCDSANGLFGKSKTIAWLAHQLSNLFGTDNKPIYDSIIVITDRIILDKQLQKQIKQFEKVNGTVKTIMPSGYRFIVTNPPYGSKSVATKNRNKAGDSGDDYQAEFENFSNIYLRSIQKCLDEADYVAAIIPLSFINSGQFREHLETVVSLNYRLFKKTTCPVCLALFRNWEKDQGDPTPCETFAFWIGDKSVGFFDDLDFVNQYQTTKSKKMEKNVQGGQVGLYGFDLEKGRTIKFYMGEEISDSKVKKTSRSITKINLNRKDVDLETIVLFANQLLEQQRNATGDSFLTPFNGLRKDSQYRQRLSFEDAEYILKLALHQYDLILGNPTFMDIPKEDELNLNRKFRLKIDPDKLFSK